jgi:hypothetical protein
MFHAGFSVAAWSLLLTNNNVNWSNNGSVANITEIGTDNRTLTLKLLRDIIDWGIWKVFGQVDEPIKGSNIFDFTVVCIN